MIKSLNRAIFDFHDSMVSHRAMYNIMAQVLWLGTVGSDGSQHSSALFL
jgi:hypothetical protein